MVDFASMPAYEPRWPGVKELNLADQWRARWVNEQELPEGAPVHYLYALLGMGDKGYAVRAAGENRWGMLEGLVGDLSAEDFLKTAAKERAGLTIGQTALVGFLECKPTSHNAEFTKDDVVVRPIFVVQAKSVADVPANSGYERRRFPLNEYVVALRTRYPELIDYLTLAVNRYATLK
jgi:hypothetical protein